MHCSESTYSRARIPQADRVCALCGPGSLGDENISVSNVLTKYSTQLFQQIPVWVLSTGQRIIFR